MKFRTSMILSAALICAPAAMAQTTQTSPAPAAPAQEGTTGAGTASTAAAVSDAEVTQFATAALAVAKVRQDATVPDAEKNAKMVEAITATGLPAQRFNEIAQAMQSDTALNKKIQDAAAAQQPAAAAAPTPK
jgi:opacity protein-like surface antigen